MDGNEPLEPMYTPSGSGPPPLAERYAISWMHDDPATLVVLFSDQREEMPSMVRVGVRLRADLAKLLAADLMLSLARLPTTPEHPSA